MTTIIIEGLEIYAYHGHLEEEKRTGIKFVVDIKIKINSEKSLVTDNLNDTLDYTTICNIVKHEMQEKSNLVENVTYRIAKKIFDISDIVEYLTVKISKVRPTINMLISSFAIEWCGTRDDLKKIE